MPAISNQKRGTNMKDRPTSFEELPLVLTIDELAPLLNLGRNTVYELVRCGQIKSIKVGSQYRILKNEIQNFLGVPDQPPRPEPTTFGSLRRRHGRKPNI